LRGGSSQNAGWGSLAWYNDCIIPIQRLHGDAIAIEMPVRTVQKSLACFAVKMLNSNESKAYMRLCPAIWGEFLDLDDFYQSYFLCTVY